MRGGHHHHRRTTRARVAKALRVTKSDAHRYGWWEDEDRPNARRKHRKKRNSTFLSSAFGWILFLFIIGVTLSAAGVLK